MILLFVIKRNIILLPIFELMNLLVYNYLTKWNLIHPLIYLQLLISAVLYCKHRSAIDCSQLLIINRRKVSGYTRCNASTRCVKTTSYNCFVIRNNPELGNRATFSQGQMELLITLLLLLFTRYMCLCVVCTNMQIDRPVSCCSVFTLLFSTDRIRKFALWKNRGKKYRDRSTGKSTKWICSFGQ